MSPTLTPQLVSRDLPCVRCGYQLRDLPENGLCPECGGQISRSIHGDLLRFADPYFLRSLRAGANIVYWSLVTGLSAFISGVVGMILVGVVLGGRSPSMFVAAAAWFVVLASFVGMFIGWWMLSTPDPARLGIDEGLTWRRWVRTSTLLALLVILATGAMPLMGGAWLRAMGLWRLSSFVPGAVATGAITLHYLAAGKFLLLLAPRVESAALKDLSRRVVAGTIVTFACSAFAFAGYLAAPFVFLGIGALLGLIYAFANYAKAAETAKHAFDATMLRADAERVAIAGISIDGKIQSAPTAD